jgi:uncharacterized protein
LTAYLDTGVLLATLIVEPTTEAVYEFLGGNVGELLVSDFAAAEVASALSRLVRMALLTATDASARLADFDACKRLSPRRLTSRCLTRGWRIPTSDGLI